MDSDQQNYKLVQQKGLDITTGRGQAYDGSVSMSSESVWLGARITETNSKLKNGNAASNMELFLMSKPISR